MSKGHETVRLIGANLGQQRNYTARRSKVLSFRWITIVLSG